MASTAASGPSSAQLKPMQKPEWSITSGEVEQGCILWLGRRDEALGSQARRGVSMDPVINVKTGRSANSGMYEHPILVVSRPASDPYKIFFLSMTSLSGQTLEERYSGRKSSFHQATFIGVTPAPDHPHFTVGDTRYRTLTLENGDELEKPTYVNIREGFVMDWRDAQLYWGADATLRKHWKLDGASMRTVIRLSSSNAGIYVDTQYRTGASILPENFVTGQENRPWRPPSLSRPLREPAPAYWEQPHPSPLPYCASPTATTVMATTSSVLGLAYTSVQPYPMPAVSYPTRTLSLRPHAPTTAPRPLQYRYSTTSQAPTPSPSPSPSAPQYRYNATFQTPPPQPNQYTPRSRP